jgi:hypothetical protein
MDISFAFRRLSKHRVYAVTAIFSMSLGIGATAAAYSVPYGIPIRTEKPTAWPPSHSDRAGTPPGDIYSTKAGGMKEMRVDSP